MTRNKVSPRRFIVLMPTRGTVTAETLTAFVNNAEGHDIVLRTVNRQPVDRARNRLAELALEAAGDPSLFDAGADPFVFWIDSDAFFLDGTLTMMLRRLEADPSIDLLAPLCGARCDGSSPGALLRIDDPSSVFEPGVDVERGSLVAVQMASTHFLLHRASLLRRLGPEPFGPADDATATDDFYFCARILGIGGRIVVDTGIPVFHVDERDGRCFLPNFDSVVLSGNSVAPPVHKQPPLPMERRDYGPRVSALIARNDAGKPPK